MTMENNQQLTINEKLSNPWLLDLIDEYGMNKSESAIRRLAGVFGDQDPAVMQMAVFNYMRSGGKYFPRVAELWPFVSAAADMYGKAGDHPGDQHLAAAKIRRQQAIEDAYRGQGDPAEFAALIAFYRRWGYEFAADWLAGFCARVGVAI